MANRQTKRKAKQMEYQQELNDKIEQLLARNTELEAQLANKNEANELTALHNRISELEAQLANKEQALVSQAEHNRRHNENIWKLDAWITENTETLGEELAEELCDLFDLTYTTKHEVTLTISATAILELPRGYDLDNISTWEFEATLDYSGDGELLEADVDIEDINY